MITQDILYLAKAETSPYLQYGYFLPKPSDLLSQQEIEPIKEDFTLLSPLTTIYDDLQYPTLESVSILTTDNYTIVDPNYTTLFAELRALVPLAIKANPSPFIHSLKEAARRILKTDPVTAYYYAYLIRLLYLKDFDYEKSAAQARAATDELLKFATSSDLISTTVSHSLNTLPDVDLPFSKDVVPLIDHVFDTHLRLCPQAGPAKPYSSH